MKKIVFVILLLVLPLTGCNDSKDVPEQLIEYAVEDYYNQYALKSAINYEYSSESIWDKETKTCTVDIKVSTEYAYGYRYCSFTRSTKSPRTYEQFLNAEDN